MARVRKGRVHLASPGSTPGPKALTGPKGLRLVLRFSVDELRQRDVEKFMGAVRLSPLGDSPIEYNGKVVRAAVDAGWVVEPKLKAEDVADMLPWQAAWFARQIDKLYIAAVTVPKA